MSSFIPIEIVSKILQKAPTKSVYRFRCVNKPWNNLLSDPSFLVNRISNHILIGLYSSPNYLSIYPKENGEISYVIENFKVPVEISSSFSTGSNLHLLAYCNGLILSLLDSKLFLWNPLTHDCIKLPKLDFFMCGFGHDSVTDDYKVLVITAKNGIQVFSPKSRTWKKIANFPLNPNFALLDEKQMAVSVNGVLHWLQDTEEPGEKNTFCFNLVKSQFAIVVEPPVTHCHSLDYLCAFEGFLCMVYRSYGKRGKMWSVWVMKEYGVKESWTKLMDIPSRSGVKPLCFNEYGELIYQVDDKQLMKYNSTNGECKKFFCAESRIIPVVYEENVTRILRTPKATDHCSAETQRV